MKECQQHFPVPIETVTILEPPEGSFKWAKDNIGRDLSAPRYTKVLKLQCFSCGEVIELNQDVLTARLARA